MLTNRVSILVVDDELGPRESLRMILKPHYETLTAHDGRSALEIIYSRQVDMVTLDLKMNGPGGLDLLKAIKQYDPNIEVIIVTGYGTLKSAIEAIRYGVIDYILKPFNVFEILQAIGKGLERRRMRSAILEKMNGSGTPASLRDFVASVAKEAESSGSPAPGEIKNGERYLDFLKVLAYTLENKDEYTHGHSGRVTYYSGLIADRIGMSDEEKKHLQLAAYLHDIGKLGISNSVVDKEDRLSSREWSVVHEHPEKGVALIEPLNVPTPILDIIRSHHERYDGCGYPHGLRGAEIPLGARIVCLADAYDAMSSNRPYRRALTREAIRNEIRRCAGSHFCPELAKEFLCILEEEDLAKSSADLSLTPDFFITPREPRP